MKRTLLGAVVLVWFGLVLSGTALLERYKAAPGEAAAAPAAWPKETSLKSGAGKPTLVMFAHPRCPCTAATLSELARLKTRLGDAVAAHIVFVRPDGTDEAWRQTRLWAKAQDIAGVELHEDVGAVEAVRFGSTTSGQVLLYGTDGALQFAGGITLARGHEGDSPGAARIAELVEKGHTERTDAPVFGCPLHDEESR